jgi:hypothetical protein
MNNTDRKIILHTKGMDGSDGISRLVISTPYGRRNTIDVFTHHRDFIDDVIDSLLQADNAYELKRKLKKVIDGE